ncbi:hypothetical protein Mgra_00004039 [Meloidogyne graminicola]|uniref:Large ribosomal subunit protein P2 n=1 Tax=Meloidogyne graminicola TaxID=189291 RepID=A0A8S9ZS39_9BILA|nr:hypothetical protein Mgra_00004039 [Meloidogyne graminicola]
MKYVAAYMLASLGGNAQPSAKDLEKILGAGGLDVDMENANAVVKALEGKNLEEVIAAGEKKLSSVPSGAPVVAPAATGAPSAAPAAEEKKEEKKKEEKKEESDDDDMGFGLFD